MDFTLKKYHELLSALKQGGYSSVLPSSGSFNGGRSVMLRHDVDKKPLNSLEVAKMEAEMGFQAVYYFRAVPCSWDEAVIRKIAALGHEIGYHYESLTTCDGNIDEAWEDFKMNLSRLRELAPVTSICMHGSPRSPWDSKDLWKKYDYHTEKIDFEPYLDTDFSQVFYLTDTGRRWDGWRYSLRDIIPVYQEKWISEGLVYHSTKDIVSSLNASTFPDRLMMTTHPQRWTDSPIAWFTEFCMQNLKNIRKMMLKTSGNS